jgi:hypothetical protein
MVNRECNYVNHFYMEIKTTPSSKKFIQPYQIALKLYFEDIKKIFQKNLAQFPFFVYPPFSL